MKKHLLLTALFAGMTFGAMADKKTEIVNMQPDPNEMVAYHACLLKNVNKNRSPKETVRH